MTAEEERSWFDDGDYLLHLVFSHNFIDYAAKKDPFKRSVTMTRLTPLSSKRAVKVEIPLTYHLASFDDELIDPLKREDETFEFMSTSS